MSQYEEAQLRYLATKATNEYMTHKGRVSIIVNERLESEKWAGLN